MHSLTSEQQRVVDSASSHWVVSGPPRSGKTTVLVERLRVASQRGLEGERVRVLVPDRRAARRANAAINTSPGDVAGQPHALSYYTFAQELIRRWWPLVAAHFQITAPTPEFLPFNLTQFACLNEYRSNPGTLQGLTIREQRLIVQVLSNMNLSMANGLSLEEGWERVALGIGASPDDAVIRDGLDLTLRFRERCIRAGLLPVDLQIAAAGWLLDDERVCADLTTRFDLLAIDDLDEFVPLLAERLARAAASCREAVVTSGDDGGLRWLLGASARTASEICNDLIEGGTFQRAPLTHSFSGSDAAQDGSAAWLASTIADGSPASPASFAAWQLHEAQRPDEMAHQVADAVAELIAAGSDPADIALLIPYMDSLIVTELERLIKRYGIPFHLDRRWHAVLDDPLSRACLTALRCVNPGKTRPATLVEVADMVVALAETNPVLAHPWAREIFDQRSGGLCDVRGKDGVPRSVQRLGWWAGKVTGSERGIPWQLETFARHVLAPHESLRRRSLVGACYALANEARRFTDAAPRLRLEQPYEQRFFEYVDSNVVAADSGLDTVNDAVLLTTPYAFLTSGRTAREQCWLNVASPSWWEPPLLLLTNPHSLSGDVGPGPLTFADDDRVRSMVLGRVIRNLAARCDGTIYAFASMTGSDGEPLDGPLYDCMVELRSVAV